MHKRPSVTNLVWGGVIAALLILSPAFAQESTPEPVQTEPIPTFTETPSPTLTPTASETPSPTWTPTASETATDTPTLTPPPPTVEVTAEITPELTPEITPEITSQPTATAQPTATTTPLPSLPLRHSDSFDVPNVSVWYDPIYAMLVPDGVGTGNVVQFNGYGDHLLYFEGYLDDLSVSARFAFEAGTLHLLTRYSKEGYYDTTFNGAGQIELWKVTRPNGTVERTLLGTSATAPASMTWQTLTMTVVGGDHYAMIDGTAVISVQDPNPLPPGTIRIYSDIQQGGPFWMDDFALYGTQKITPRTPLVSDDILGDPLAADVSDSRVLYSDFHPNDFSRRDIYARSSDPLATDRTNLTNGLFDASHPEWSADGQTISFVTQIGGGPQEYVLMNADGTNIRSFLFTAHYQSNGDLLITGANEGLLAYTWVKELRLRHTSSQTHQVLAHLDTLLSVPTAYSRSFQGAVSWSPDGSRLAVGYQYSQSNSFTCFGFFILNSQTGAEVGRIEHCVGYSHFPRIHYVDWSRDGTTILVSENYDDSCVGCIRKGILAVFPVNALSLANRVVVRETPAGISRWFEGGVALSPDGSEVIYAQPSQGIWSLYKVPVACANTCTAVVLMNFTYGYNYYNNTLDWWGPTLACPPLDVMDQADNAHVQSTTTECLVTELFTNYNVEIVDSEDTLASEWTDEQVSALYSSVTKTAQALGIFAREVNDNESRSDAEIFIAVMVDDVDNVLQVEIVSGSNCSTKQIPVGNAIAKISCYSDATEWTFTHELGHVLVGRTGGQAAANGFYGLVNGPVPEDARNAVRLGGQIVFGEFAHSITPPPPPPPLPTPTGTPPSYSLPDWQRGSRGWETGADRLLRPGYQDVYLGSRISPPEQVYLGPCNIGTSSTGPGLPTDFQQNPCHVRDWVIDNLDQWYTATPTQLAPLSPNQISELKPIAIEETAADMFLNWVYRTIGEGGFANLDWENISSSLIDEGSGDIRFNWMNCASVRLFNVHGFWEQVDSVEFPTDFNCDNFPGLEADN